MRRIVVFLISWCVCAGVGMAQTPVYVSAEGSDMWSGAAATPFKTVHKALEKVKNTGGAAEIRVAVGVYPISAGNKGELIIPAHVTVKGGFSKNGVAVQNELAGNPDKPEGQTIFQGDSTCRIATVEGVLERVVVTGGRAEGGNGGGVLVEAGGSLRDCIVRGNKASGRLPKVGDIILESGDFMDVSQYRYGQEDDVKGIVFWLNPQRDAPIGQRGRAVSIKMFSLTQWVSGPLSGGANVVQTIKNELLKNVVCLSLPEEALLDTDGNKNTDLLLKGSYSVVTGFPLAKACREYGSEWYLPAAGELMWMLAEWSTVDNTYKILWDYIQKECQEDVTVMAKYFNLPPNVPANAKWYEKSGMLWVDDVGGRMASSSLSSQNGCTVWVLTNFTGSSRLDCMNLINSMGKSVKYDTFRAYAVRCF